MITEERKQRLFHNLQKLEAYEEIQNTMGRLVAALNFHEKDKVLRFFALSQPDVSVEYADEGRFTGAEAVEAVVNMVLEGEAKPGEMLDMQLTTPIIEVAGDLRTAKGLWWCPGAGARRIRKDLQADESPIPGDAAHSDRSHSELLTENEDPAALWYFPVLPDFFSLKRLF